MSTLLDLFNNLEALEREIDDSDEITEAQCAKHFDAIKEIDNKVDRLLGYMDACKINAAKFDAKAQEYKSASQKWEKRLESLKNYALFLLKRDPNISYRGSEKQIVMKLNAPSLVCSIRKAYSSTNIIPDGNVFSVPTKYREAVTFWVLKTDVLRADLKAGETFNFASLERKESLQIKLKEDAK